MMALMEINSDLIVNLSIPLRAIQEAVRKAIRWNHSIITGEVTGIGEIAEKHNVSERYISLLLKFAYLSPDIIQHVFKGDIPHDLTLGKLKLGFDSDFQKQHKMFDLHIS